MSDAGLAAGVSTLASAARSHLRVITETQQRLPDKHLAASASSQLEQQQLQAAPGLLTPPPSLLMLMLSLLTHLLTLAHPLPPLRWRWSWSSGSGRR